MRIRLNSSMFTPKEANTGELFDPKTVRAATNQKIADAVGGVLYGTNGLLIEEDVIEITFGRGKNAEIYQTKRPEVDDEGTDIELTLGGTSD